MRAVNLIPAEQRSGAAAGAGRSGGAAYAVLVALGGLALCLFLYGRADHQVSSDRKQVAQLNAEAQAAQAKAGQLAPYASFIGLREQREQAVALLAGTRFDWAHVMHEFGRVLPPDTSISSLSGTVGSASPSGSAKAGTPGTVSSSTPAGSVPSFALSGCATNQRTVAAMLTRLRLIAGVSEVTLSSSTLGGTAGAAASAGASGACPVHAAEFSVSVSFQPLPAASAASGSPAGASTTTATAATTATAPTTGAVR